MVDDSNDEHSRLRRAEVEPPLPRATGLETTGPEATNPTEVLHRGLDPEALFGDFMFLDEQQTVQWLGHLQRLASTGLMAGGMAHDLAGLIQPLLSECERVLLKDDPENYRESLVKMREWARRSAGYVRALLDLVRRDEQVRAAVPVERVVEDTLGLLEATRKLAGVSIRRNLDNRHLAYVDRTRLMQAVVNLVSNAMHAAGEGGHEVEVTVRGWRGFVLVEVEDNGPGVPKHIQEHIFQPFVHEDARRGRRNPTGTDPTGTGPTGTSRTGTGLGLYITKRLIEEQGGRIEFETEAGVGTVFRLMLEPAPREEWPAEATRDENGEPSK